MCCCLEVIVKFVLFAVNTITGLASIALITLGSILVSYMNQVDQLDIPALATAIPIMIIVSGVIIFIVSFSGCCGAISEIQCLLIMYSIFMLIFAALKTYVAVFIFQALSSVHETITTWVNRMFDAHQADGGFFALERLIRCCGTTGEDSYANMGFIPGTCCANPIPVDAPIAGGSICQAGTTFDGCATILADTVRKFGLPLGSFVIGVVIVELAAMVFAIFLIIRISSKRNSDARKQYY